MSRKSLIRPDLSWPARLAPLGIFTVLAVVTGLAWSDHVRQERAMMQRHAHDVCMQASRRLQILAESSLRAGDIFSRRWVSHHERDFSRQRFEDFATVLVAEVPGYQSAWLLSADKSVSWMAPRGANSAWPKAPPEYRFIVDQARVRGQTVLSAPLRTEGNDSRFFAAMPLVRDDEFLGYMVIEFDTYSLINEAFHEPIRSEFRFRVEDGEQELYRYDPEGISVESRRATEETTQSVELRNRVWRFVVAPRGSLADAWARAGNPLILALGLVLSVGLSGLVYLLLARMAMYRWARDSAMQEMAAREKAQVALAASESRYRSVFDSATDGLLVIDAQDVIVEANPAACTMHGFDAGELDGKSIRGLIAPDYLHQYDQYKGMHLAPGMVQLEAAHRCRDDTKLEVEVRASRFRLEKQPMVLAIVTNVTQRNRAMQRLALLSREVLMAQEDERARVSRDLHDELGQLLMATRLELGWLQKKTASGDGQAASAVQNASELVEKAADELRRICRGLRPPLLDDLGLEPAVRLLVREFEERTNITMDIEVALDESAPALPKEVALCTYRIIQESLNNVSRHAAAKSVDITLASTPTQLIVSVYDDGRGFDIAQMKQFEGCGLAGMHERAKLVGGDIEVLSEPSRGTRIVFRVALKKDSAAGRYSHDSHVGR